MILGSGLLLSSQAGSSLTSGLIRYWSFDNQTATDSVISATSSVQGLTYNNVSGVSSYYAQFNTSSCVTASTTEDLKQSIFTVSFWMNVSASNGNILQIFNTNTGSFYRGFSAYCSLISSVTQSVGLSVWPGSGFGGGGISIIVEEAEKNTWVHYVLSYKNQAMIIYKNGAYAFSAGTGPPDYDPSSDTQICLMGPDFIHSGLRLSASVDEVGYWGRQLQSREVLLLYNAGAGKFYPFT